jgi:hypothetical protein
MVKVMAKVDEKSKPGAQAAVNVKPRFDGPHDTLYKKKKPEEEASNPAYVVSVTKQEKKPEDEPTPSIKQLKYNPEEQRAKARAFLKSGLLAPADRKALEEVLGPEKEKS